jgi:hypothetical protein
VSSGWIVPLQPKYPETSLLSLELANVPQLAYINIVRAWMGLPRREMSQITPADFPAERSVKTLQGHIIVADRANSTFL